MSDAIYTEALSLGDRIQSTAIDWNSSTNYPVLGFIGSRAYAIILKPIARIVDVSLHIIIGIGKIVTALVLVPFSFCVRQLGDFKMIVDWIVKQCVFHFGCAGRYAFDIFASPIINIINPGIYQSSLREKIQLVSSQNLNSVQQGSNSKKARKFIIYFPCSAGWEENQPSGQLTRANKAHAFVQHMLQHNIEVEAYFVDPKFADPSTHDAKEISQFPPNFHAVGSKSKDFSHEPLFRDPETPCVSVEISYGVWAFAPGHNFKTHVHEKNRLRFICKNEFLDPFLLIQHGNYDLVNNRFDNESYNFQKGDKLPNTYYELSHIATGLFSKLLSIRLGKPSTDMVQNLQDINVFVEDFLSVHPEDSIKKDNVKEWAYAIFAYIAKSPNEFSGQLWKDCNCYYNMFFKSDAELLTLFEANGEFDPANIRPSPLGYDHNLPHP